MQPMVAAFADELVKIAEQKKGHGKNYLRSALVGAAAVPMTSLVQAVVNRKIHNTGITRAMQEASTLEKAQLAKHLKKGPLLTPAEIGGQAAAGGVGGSVVQWMRDRFGS